MDCIFCSISSKETEADIVYEDNQLIAFKDINPKAPIHILIVPKEHIASINDLSEENQELVGRMIYQAKLIAKEQKIAESGYKLVFNCGKNAGQLIEHIHLHLLGGQSLGGIL